MSATGYPQMSTDEMHQEVTEKALKSAFCSRS